MPSLCKLFANLILSSNLEKSIYHLLLIDVIYSNSYNKFTQANFLEKVTFRLNQRYQNFITSSEILLA